MPSATPASVFNNRFEGTPGEPPPVPLNTAVERREYRNWLQKATAAGVTLGPR